MMNLKKIVVLFLGLVTSGLVMAAGGVQTQCPAPVTIQCANGVCKSGDWSGKIDSQATLKAISFNGAAVLSFGENKIYCNYGLSDGEIASIHSPHTVSINDQKNWTPIVNNQAFCDQAAGAVDPSYCQFKLNQ